MRLGPPPCGGAGLCGYVGAAKWPQWPSGFAERITAAMPINMPPIVEASGVNGVTIMGECYAVKPDASM